MEDERKQLQIKIERLKKQTEGDKEFAKLLEVPYHAHHDIIVMSA